MRSIPTRQSFLIVTIVAVLLFTPFPAQAASVSDASYTTIMSSLDEIETLINSTLAKLQNGMSAEDARAALPHLKERLQWMRDTKVAAARIDTDHTLRARNTDSQRAQCIIMRAGLMDEAFQDVMVNVSMKARGASENEMLPIERTPNTTRDCR
jgi:hypothetical protein